MNDCLIDSKCSFCKGKIQRVITNKLFSEFVGIQCEQCGTPNIFKLSVVNYEVIDGKIKTCMYSTKDNYRQELIPA